MKDCLFHRLVSTIFLLIGWLYCDYLKYSVICIDIFKNFLKTSRHMTFVKYVNICWLKIMSLLYAIDKYKYFGNNRKLSKIPKFAKLSDITVKLRFNIKTTQKRIFRQKFYCIIMLFIKYIRLWVYFEVRYQKC